MLLYGFVLSSQKMPITRLGGIADLPTRVWKVAHKKWVWYGSKIGHATKQAYFRAKRTSVVGSHFRFFSEKLQGVGIVVFL